jgi:hypothetical protein
MAGAAAGIGAVVSAVTAAGEPAVDGGAGDDVFGRRFGGTRFDVFDALAAGPDFFPRVDAVRFVETFGACAASLPASAETSSVQRTPRPPRAAGILIARFDKVGSPFARLPRQFTYRGFAEENHGGGPPLITER